MKNHIPKLLGYRLPAEWEPHAATWIAWPKNRDTFPEKILPKVEETYCEIIEALRKGEKVKIMVDNEEWVCIVEKTLEMHGVGHAGVEFRQIQTRDVWVRDYGPTFIKALGEKLGGVKWIFNAWGMKYPDLAEDDSAGMKLLLDTSAEAFMSELTIEGGAIETDGQGTIITTKESILNKNRNSGLTKKNAERILSDYLGISDIVWLDEGLVGDDTDGHIDVFCRFISRDKLLLVWDERHSGPNMEIMNKNKRALEKWIENSGREIDLVFLPLPSKIKVLDMDVPASYANFYIGNRSILVPVFECKDDETAIRILQESISNKEIVPIKSRELFYGLGGIHCITLQEPMHE